MNELGKPDRPMVPGKSSKKARTPVAEEMEVRGLAKGNLGQKNAPRTQSRISAPSELAQAKSNKDVKFNDGSCVRLRPTEPSFREKFYT